MTRLLYAAISSADCGAGSLDDLNEALALDCRRLFEEGIEAALYRL